MPLHHLHRSVHIWLFSIYKLGIFGNTWISVRLPPSHFFFFLLQCIYPYFHFRERRPQTLLSILPATRAQHFPHCRGAAGLRQEAVGKDSDKVQNSGPRTTSHGWCKGGWHQSVLVELLCFPPSPEVWAPVLSQRNIAVIC